VRGGESGSGDDREWRNRVDVAWPEGEVPERLLPTHVQPHTAGKATPACKALLALSHTGRPDHRESGTCSSPTSFPNSHPHPPVADHKSREPPTTSVSSSGGGSHMGLGPPNACSARYGHS
jgi:hypothetical protein